MGGSEFTRRVEVALVLFVGALHGACASDDTPGARPTRDDVPSAVASSPAAHRRLAELRHEFGHTAASELFAATEARFVPNPGGELRATFPDQRRDGALAAEVTLPSFARGWVRVQESATRLAVSFSLRNAPDAPGRVTEGVVVYSSNPRSGARDVIHRVRSDGTEDSVVFEQRPEREELVYDVRLEGVMSLRSVAGRLEFLDEGGVPRLRVARPFLVDADGRQTALAIGVEGCAVDTSPAAPWGRQPAAAVSDSCIVRLFWSGTSPRYPVAVDPAWITTSSLSVARGTSTADLLTTGDVLVAGGVVDDNSAELFHPATRTFAMTGSMSGPRYRHASTPLPSGKILIAGGLGQPSGTAELYDPATGKFEGTGAMNEARADFTATLLESGDVLLVGSGELGFNRVRTAETYSETTGTFTRTAAEMSQPRNFHTATLLPSSKVLVAGGEGDLLGFLSAELFDPATRTFEPTGDMRWHRTRHVAALLDSGKVYLTGGWDGGAELYDPNKGEFVETPGYGYIVGATATKLPSGNVLVVGGVESFITALTSLYFPSPESFLVLTEWMKVPRYFHQATLLPNGDVLVTGGGTPAGGGATAVAEIWHMPAAGDLCYKDLECASGICNGACCAGFCGPCSQCAEGTGTCEPRKGSSDPHSCAYPERRCDLDGVCKVGDGQTCTSGDVCASGLCVDGVCCIDDCHGGAADDCFACSRAAGGRLDGECTGREGVACDDGDQCTTSDQCDFRGACGGAAVPCSPTAACHEYGTCDPATGVCSDPISRDGTTCANGTCNAGACVTPEAGVDAEAGIDARTGTGGGGGAEVDGGLGGNRGGRDAAAKPLSDAEVGAATGSTTGAGGSSGSAGSSSSGGTSASGGTSVDSGRTGSPGSTNGGAMSGIGATAGSGNAPGTGDKSSGGSKSGGAEADAMSSAGANPDEGCGCSVPGRQRTASDAATIAWLGLIAAGLRRRERRAWS